MAYTIANLKVDLTGIMHGTNLNKIQGLNALIDRAASTVLLDVDPMETKRIQQLPLLFDEIYDYSVAIPNDIKGNRIIDIRPQNYIRYSNENPGQRYNRMFDLFKGKQRDNIMFTVQHNTGIKSLRIDYPDLPEGIVLNSLSDINDNGTWATTGDAINLATDFQYFATNASSLRFDTNGAGLTAGLQLNMTSAIDLTNHSGLSSLFNWVYLPTAANVTNVILQWGSSPTDYWQQTVTTDIFGNSFTDNWNLLKFDWNTTVTTVGAPVASAVDFLSITVTYNGTAEAGYRFDAVTSTLGLPYEIEYYSKYIFRNATTGAFQENVLLDSDIVNLDTETRNLLLYKVAELAIQQQHDFGYKPGSSEMLPMKQIYLEHLSQYRKLYKSEVTKPTQQYYRPGRSTGSGWINRAR